MYKTAIMQEDIADQVSVKETRTNSNSCIHLAMRSAMSIINGDKDKRAMFDQALEAVADDVSQKVGEMERFMELSDNFMKSIDLQNGVFEEEGMKMLEKWEHEGVSKLLGDEKLTWSTVLMMIKMYWTWARRLLNRSQWVLIKPIRYIFR